MPASDGTMAAELGSVPVIFPELGIQLEIPDGIERVILDIGIANEIRYGGPDTLTIAVEASIKEVIENDLVRLCALPNCILFHTAISNSKGVLQLWQTTRSGGNSLDVPDKDRWPMELGSALVPVLPFSTLLAAVPSTLPLAYCKTDTNGNDHRVLRSAGAAIARCGSVEAEFITDGSSGPLCQQQNAAQFMATMGYSIKICEVNDLYDDVIFTTPHSAHDCLSVVEMLE